MEKRKLITSIIGIVLIIIGLISCIIFPDASSRFFIGGLITWLGVIFLAGTFLKK